MHLQDCDPDDRCCIFRPSRRGLQRRAVPFMAWGCPSSPCRGKSPGEWQFMHRGCRRTGTSAVKSDPSRAAGRGAEVFFEGGSAAAKGKESSRRTADECDRCSRGPDCEAAFHTASERRMGSRRIRFPVAANNAFAIAGAAHGTPGSPIPPDFSLLSTM